MYLEYGLQGVKAELGVMAMKGIGRRNLGRQA